LFSDPLRDLRGEAISLLRNAVLPFRVYPNRRRPRAEAQGLAKDGGVVRTGFKALRHSELKRVKSVE
jgi:hypothetical protein